MHLNLYLHWNIFSFTTIYNYIDLCIHTYIYTCTRLSFVFTRMYMLLCICNCVFSLCSNLTSETQIHLYMQTSMHFSFMHTYKRSDAFVDLHANIQTCMHSRTRVRWHKQTCMHAHLSEAMCMGQIDQRIDELVRWHSIRNICLPVSGFSPVDRGHAGEAVIL